jgi:Dyp-type peroxidase family
MIYLAADNQEALEKEIDATAGKLIEARVGKILRVQRGSAIRREDEKKGREHFGFADSLSQPLFLKADLARRQGDIWNPVAPLDLALVPDPFARDEWSFGSFLVYRKLEQDVDGFEAQIKALAQVATSGDEELARAQVIGRFQDGTPVALSSTSVDRPSLNDFDYTPDPGGGRCPFHAHIRKVNPRTAESRSRRIVRRGVPYEEKNGRNGKTKKGLHFLCFQADIQEQFAHLQEMWASNPDFPVTGSGVDPLIGQNGHGSGPQQWPKGWGSHERAPFSLHSFVTLKGGEFFFAPSLSFLKGL